MPEPLQVVPADVLRRAIDCVLSGGLLLYPTDTVYGLGGDSTRSEVTKRIHELKGSDPNKPLLVLTDSWERVADWIGQSSGITSAIAALAESYSLTILFPATPAVPKSLIGTSDRIGIRLCKYPFCVDLIRQTGRPISSTSANRTGNPPPIRLDDVAEVMLDGVDLSVDGGELAGRPSTIVRPEGKSYTVIREGSLPASELAKLLS